MPVHKSITERLAELEASAACKNRCLWVRLYEKRSERQEMPCHHILGNYPDAYMDATKITKDRKGPLFCTIGRGMRELTRTPLPQPNAVAMIKRRAASAGISTRIGNHTFLATGITTSLKK